MAKKPKMRLQELFKEEGMYHSISQETMRRSLTFLKTPHRDLERQALAEEMRLLEEEERYNQTLFDKDALRKIEIGNLKRLNPFDAKVVRHQKQEKKEEDRRKLMLD